VRVSQVSTLLLGLFLLLHGLYHTSEFVGNDFFSDDILEPTSILILLAFSLYVSKYVFIPRLRKNVSRERATDNANPSKRTVAIKNNSSIPLIAIPFLALLLTAYLSAFIYKPAETFSLFGIVASALIFGIMAIRNPAYRELHFQFAIIVLIWAAAEIPHNLDSIGLISLTASVSVLGTWVHFLSMFFIGVFICVRVIKVVLFPARMPIPPKAREA
jgi:hypothetical protein